MRKALILMLAATVLTPIAAQAQPREGTDDVDRQAAVQERYERQAQRNQQRYEQRQQRQAQRAQPAQAPAQAPVAVVQRQRGDGNRAEWRQQRQEARQQRQVQTQSPPVVDTQRQRGEWRRGDRNRQLPSTQGWAGPNNDPRLRDDADRYNRLARENALRDGTRQQRREVIQERREDRRDWRQDRREDRRDWRQDRRADRRDWQREWNRDSWRGDRRYDWQNYRYRNRNVFRVSPYYSPYRNHRYSRFSIGFFLDSLFYDRRYWIGDPWQYRLPAAPYGTQWIRYYDDVLLVDVYSGEVIDVIHDFFW